MTSDQGGAPRGTAATGDAVAGYPVGTIRTSHVGSLPRPPDLLAAIAERERGGPELDPEAVRAAVADVVRRQVDVGLDVVNDGEAAKVSYVTYVRNRLTGFAPGSRSPERPDPAVADFPVFAAARRARRAAAAPVQLPVCRDEIRYPDTSAVDADIAALRAALADDPEREAFLTAASPGVIALFLADEHYGDREAYLDALAEAMKTEYDAVHAAGLLLQLDCPDLASPGRRSRPTTPGCRSTAGWSRRTWPRSTRRCVTSRRNGSGCTCAGELRGAAPPSTCRCATSLDHRARGQRADDLLRGRQPAARARVGPVPGDLRCPTTR